MRIAKSKAEPSFLRSAGARFTVIFAYGKGKADLDEARSTIVKKDIELRKKEKIIENLSKEDDVQAVREENMSKAKDSTLVTLVKRKYYELKSEYDKVVKENEVLKANVKLTKIKEIKMETDILQQEYAKMKQLYKHMQEQNKCNVNEISQLKAFQHEYFKQHQLVCALRDNYEHAREECKRSTAEIAKLKEKLSHKETLNKKLMLQTQKLQSANDRLLSEKKQKEKNLLSQYDYQKKLAETTRLLSIYKTEHKQTQQPQSVHVANANNYNYVDSRLQDDEANSKDNKLKTYSDIIKDMEIKISIYEQYISSKGDNPCKVLRSKGYNGTINSNTNSSNKHKCSSTNPTISSQDTTEHYKIPTNEIDNAYFKDSKNTFKLFKIVFEGNNVKPEQLTNSLNDICGQFDSKEATSKDEFLKPFINLFTKYSQTTHQKDIEFISACLNAHLEATGENVDNFLESMEEFNGSLLDYCAMYNEKDLLAQLKDSELGLYKEDLLKYLNANHSEENSNYIEFIMLDHIIRHKIGFNINNEQLDYMLYKMRSSLPKGSSVLLLDTQFVRALVNGGSDELLARHTHELDTNKCMIITEENEKEYSSDGGECNKARISDSQEGNGTPVSENRFDANSTPELYDVNKSEFHRESGRILAAMIYNLVVFDTFFEDDMQIDSDTGLKVIDKNKFFQKLNTLKLDLTKKEMNDFTKTYRINSNKSMLNVNQIKQDLHNINIKDLPGSIVSEEA